jgi:hypothetical protein
MCGHCNGFTSFFRIARKEVSEKDALENGLGGRGGAEGNILA